MPLPWEDGYFAALHVTSISQHDAATSGVFAGSNGIVGAGNGLLLNEHPTFNPGTETNFVEKTTGLSQARTGNSGIGQEFSINRVRPMFSIGNMGLTEERMGFFGWLLFQQGVTETAVTFEKTMIPYVKGEADLEVWGAFGRSFGAGTAADGHAIFGCVASQIGISGSEGELMNMSVELQGRKFITVYDHSASDATVEQTPDHAFFDYSWTIGGTAARIASWDITIANNAAGKSYGEDEVTTWLLGRMDVTGNMALAMSTQTVGGSAQIDNWISGADLLVVGTHSASAIVFTINAKYDGGDIDPAEEHNVNLPYRGAYDGTNHSIQIVADEGIDRSVPA